MLGTVNVPGAPSSELAKLKATVNKVASDARNNPGGCAVTITFDDAFAGQEFSITDSAGSLIYSGIVPEELIAAILLQNCNAVYTLKSTTSEGIVYTSIITTGPYFGQYSALCSTFSATISVSTLPGATVTVTGAGGNFTSVADDLGVAIVAVGKAGVYEVTASLHGVKSSTATVNVVDDGGAYETEVTFVQITVAVPSGSAVTVYDGSYSYSAISESGSATFLLPYSGEWNVFAELNGERASGVVDCAEGTASKIILTYASVFGVCWDMSSPSTALGRLTPLNDPHGYVTVSVNEEPVAAGPDKDGRSVFDGYLPWKGMSEVTISDKGDIYPKGTDGFSRTSSWVYIPEFFYCITELNGKRYFYVSDKEIEGFSKHPGSHKYVGRYKTAGEEFSATGTTLGSLNLEDARNLAQDISFRYGVYDYATWCAVWLLYLVEYADWDSQSTIGRGARVGEGATGVTDGMSYHTGATSMVSSGEHVQYRWIENPWGRAWEWLDGVNIYTGAIYISTDWERYKSNSIADYQGIPFSIQNDGYISSLALAPEFPWAFLPASVDGSETTYIPDECSSISIEGWGTISVGGDNFSNANGLFCINFHSPTSGGNYCARLMYHPD